MADDTIDPTAPRVEDGRVPAKGLLPRYLLVWILIGLAAVLLFVSAVSNLRAPRTVPTVKADKESPDDPKRLGNYRVQLEGDAERARELAAATPPKSLTDPAKKTSRASGGGGQATDPDATARVKREHDSLFASTMVVSRRPVAEAAAGRSGAREMGTPSPVDPSLDETVAAVLRQARPGVAQAGSVPVSAALESATPAAAGPARAKERPDRTPPIAASGPLHVLLESTVLDATLVDRLDGSSNSPVKALISGPVFSHNRQFVLIPDGTVAIGTAKAVQNYNQTRLAVSFHRLAFPDGSTVSLEQFHGLDQAGDLGLHDKVNNHYLATFGRAAAVGVLQGLGQLVGTRGFSGNGDNRTVILMGDVGNTTSTAVNNLLNRMPLPTVQITEGHRLKIYLTSDLELPAWSRRGEVRPVR